jgi:hypothetical protein
MYKVKIRKEANVDAFKGKTLPAAKREVLSVKAKGDYSVVRLKAKEEIVLCLADQIRDASAYTESATEVNKALTKGGTLTLKETINCAINPTK